MKRKVYSNLDVIDEKEFVYESTNVFQFFFRWMKYIGRTGKLQVSLPSHYHGQIEKMCKTIEEISESPFTLSHLITIQLQELVRKQEMEPNVFALKKTLMAIEDGISITQKGKRNKKVIVSLSKAQVYNMEFILSSMEEELGTHEYKVEKVIQLLIADLMYQVARGKMQKVVESLLLEMGIERKEIKEYVTRKEILI